MGTPKKKPSKSTSKSKAPAGGRESRARRGKIAGGGACAPTNKRPSAPAGLSVKDAAFCVAYVSGAEGVRGNAVRAYVAAGYSEKSAKGVAHRKLSDPRISAEIWRLQEEIRELAVKAAAEKKAVGLMTMQERREKLAKLVRLADEKLDAPPVLDDKGNPVGPTIGQLAGVIVRGTVADAKLAKEIDEDSAPMTINVFDLDEDEAIALLNQAGSRAYIAKREN